MNDNERRTILELTQDFWFCPTTGEVLAAEKHDDKVLCGCTRARGPGTHMKRFLRRATVDQYMEDYRNRHPRVR